MTVGITGVFWLPRMAEANSISLNAGAHAVPIAAASTAWGALTAAWVDATATVARVMAELGVGLQGVNGIAALARLTGFTGWAEQQGVLAAAMGAKTAANATAYTVASIAMPSLPEIAAVDGTLAAASNPAGAASGAFEVAEAAKNAMDIRAALVMETYEAATSALVTTPNQFLMPPPIANGAGVAGGTQDAAQAFQNGSADPVQAAVGAAQAVLTNPGVASAATQAAQFAGSVASTGVTTAGNVAGSAIAAAGHAAPASVGTAPMMMGGIGSATAAAGGAAATRAVSFGGGSTVSIGNGAGSLKLPEGWGANAIGGNPTATAVPESATVGQVGGPAPTRPASATGGNPLLGRQIEDEDEDDHKGNDYLRGEHFADGRVIAPGVIGGDLVAGER
ncbi:PPE family protein [Nocardia terpenica]|uniref:PPE domain-containing protein n=1 Tax=Nocardia terpenica TaxID=455432 RepID=UPI001895B823|nr:PPE domain-containing protein [Nocardia terpenica]MBF6065116.1 PPE family protein [Nocardia terpenica]MBF6108173.1 PPE family protein [Nocardia terpenica]MBF6115388.1 PPE family protein [Nocardia terpenica]MBF6122710.1 PPE family protein [Nocardia terpenica]MBF6157256.1 PPE family protein [Nocardia terpenica]